MSIVRLGAGKRLSAAVVHGGVAYLSGHVAQDPSADVAGQTEQILAQIDARLAEAGSDKSRILSANVWLADIAGFDDMNRAWEAWVDPANAPARATVEAKLAAPQYKVEIAVIAAVGE
ncbi:MAG: RidA family protein [Acidimicrobiales bacterium]